MWAGDFNSLTREDYTEAGWEEIARVRRQSSWEPPRTAVAERMRALGFVDSWASVDRPGSAATCR